MDFNLGEKPCPLKVPVNDQFEITNKTNAKIRFNFEPSFPKEFQLIFSPSAGTIDKVGGKAFQREERGKIYREGALTKTLCIGQVEIHKSKISCK